MSARSIRRSHERRARRRRVAAAAGAIGGSALFAPAAQALNFPVSNTNNAGAGSLRGAILSANGSAGADTISFNAGVSGEIRLTTGDIPITDAVTITGPGAATLSVSGDADNDDVRDFATGPGSLGDSRIFTITDPTTPGSPLMAVTISGLTLREGVSDSWPAAAVAQSGGAIYALQTDLTLTNVVLRDNVATEDGGAVYLDAEGASGDVAAELTIADSQLTNNRARDEGGAVSSVPTKYVLGDGVGTTITNTQVTGNRAGGTDFGGFGISTNPRGGGIATKYEGELNGLTVTGNTSLTDSGGNVGGDAGGISTFGGGTIADSVIRGNTAGENGGGVSLRGGKIAASTVSGNTAESAGGVLAAPTFGKYSIPGPARIDSSTISGNSATGAAPYEGNGGGVSAYGIGDMQSLVIRNTTVAGNTASVHGGGIALLQEGPSIDVEEPPVRLRGTLVGDNFTAGGPGDLSSVAYESGIGIVENADGFSAGFTLVESPGIVSLAGDPDGSTLLGVDPQLLPLGDNGGPTQTHALAPTSPAVDSSQPHGFTTDQRGQPRTLDAAATNNPLSDGTDIGAFELADPAASGDDPDTAFKKKPKKKLKLKDGKQTAKVKIKFTGTDNSPPTGPLTFECLVDKGKFDDCKSPLKLQLDKGKHTVEVRAIDADGQVDATPAKAKIKVKKAKPKK